MASDSRLYKAPADAVRAAALMAIERMEFKVKKNSNKEIEASSGFSLVSWGETLRVEISRVGTETRVTVACEPSAQAFDWGKSEDNVKTFLEHLDSGDE